MTKNIKTINYLMLISISLFLIIISSCGNTNKEDVKPENLIPKEEFIKIMVDVRMIETSIRQKINKGNNVDKATEYYYNYLFDKYKISPEQFNNSLEYYSKNIKEMKDINIAVVERLTQMETEVKAQKEVNNKK